MWYHAYIVLGVASTAREKLTVGTIVSQPSRAYKGIQGQPNCSYWIVWIFPISPSNRVAWTWDQSQFCASRIRQTSDVGQLLCGREDEDEGRSDPQPGTFRAIVRAGYTYAPLQEQVRNLGSMSAPDLDPLAVIGNPPCARKR